MSFLYFNLLSFFWYFNYWKLLQMCLDLKTVVPNGCIMRCVYTCHKNIWKTRIKEITSIVVEYLKNLKQKLTYYSSLLKTIFNYFINIQLNLFLIICQYFYILNSEKGDDRKVIIFRISQILQHSCHNISNVNSIRNTEKDFPCCKGGIKLVLDLLFLIGQYFNIHLYT